jgi:hypothetical protein
VRPPSQRIIAHFKKGLLIRFPSQFPLLLCFFQKSVMPRVALKNTTSLLRLHKLDIIRSQLNVIEAKPVPHANQNESVVFIRALVATDAPIAQTTWAELINDLRRVKWLDEQTLELGVVSVVCVCVQNSFPIALVSHFFLLEGIFLIENGFLVLIAQLIDRLRY